MSEENKIPSYFYFYTKYCEPFSTLSDEEAGQAIKHVCLLVRGLPANAEKLAPASKMLVSFMKDDINHAFKKYHAQCENGKKGGAPKGNKNAKKAQNQDCFNISLATDYENGVVSGVLAETYREAQDNGIDLHKHINQ